MHDIHGLVQHRFQSCLRHSEIITLDLFAFEIDTYRHKLSSVVALSSCLTASLENKISIKLNEVLTANRFFL